MTLANFLTLDSTERLPPLTKRSPLPLPLVINHLLPLNLVDGPRDLLLLATRPPIPPKKKEETERRREVLLLLLVILVRKQLLPLAGVDEIDLPLILNEVPRDE